MFETVAVMSIISAVGVIIVLHKLGIRRAVKYDPWTDIALTAVLAIMFAGTMTGMVIAMAAGLIISLYLLVARRFTKRKQDTCNKVTVIRRGRIIKVKSRAEKAPTL